MTFKYSVGQLVEFAPPSETPALYRIARQMPVEVLSQEEYDRMPTRRMQR